LKEGPDKTLSKKLLAFAAMTLIAGVLTSLRQMFTRDLIEFHYDMTTAGYWQALNRISDMYLMVITATLSIYYLPRLSEIKQTHELRNEVKRSLLMLVPATIAMTLVLYFMRSFIVTVVLSEEFRPIENLMGWQFAGDVLKITSWLLAMVLMVKEKVKAFLILEMVHAILSLGIFELLLSYSGAGSIGLAHFLAYALYLSMVLMVLIPLMRK
jgi:PST family polysaccharide transporter